jgi:hypothetical protein
MCADHNHGGAAERGCDNDECVEVSRHDNRANYGTDHRQNDTECATNEVIQSEDRRVRLPPSRMSALEHSSKLRKSGRTRASTFDLPTAAAR